MNIKFSSLEPPCWEELNKFVDKPMRWEDCDDVVTFGGVIYSRHLPLPPDVVVHERVHLEQQAAFDGTQLEYLHRYVQDPTFRYEQELQAYLAQAAYIERIEPERGMQARAKWKLAQDFVSMYDIPWITVAGIYKLLV